MTDGGMPVTGWAPGQATATEGDPPWTTAAKAPVGVRRSGRWAGPPPTVRRTLISYQTIEGNYHELFGKTPLPPSGEPAAFA